MAVNQHRVQTEDHCEKKPQNTKGQGIISICSCTYLALMKINNFNQEFTVPDITL